MATQWKKMAATLAAAVLLSVSAETALAQDHARDAGAQAQLTLNHGQKWAGDANLRLGMTRIRDALAAQLPAIRADKATAEQYRALAQKVQAQISFMVQNCKLDREADAMLHLVLADIIAGADAMAGQSSSEARKGAEKIAHALDNYGAYFDHPGWHGVARVH